MDDESVGKFSELEGSNHTWKWVWRYGVYTHQVPEHPDSYSGCAGYCWSLVPTEYWFLLMVLATSVRILLMSRVSADSVLYDYVTDLTYSNDSYMCTHDLV